MMHMYALNCKQTIFMEWEQRKEENILTILILRTLAGKPITLCAFKGMVLKILLKHIYL